MLSDALTSSWVQGRSQKWAIGGVLTLKYTARCQKCLFINMFKIWAQGGGSDPHIPPLGYAPVNQLSNKSGYDKKNVV